MYYISKEFYSFYRDTRQRVVTLPIIFQKYANYNIKIISLIYFWLRKKMVLIKKYIYTVL